MAAWFSTVVFILSCPLNPPRQLPWSNWWAQIKSDKAVMSPKLHFCGFMKKVTRVGCADVTRTLSAPRLICEEIASCPPKLTDNWGQQEKEDAMDYGQMGGMEVFQCVVVRCLRLNWEPKEGQGWKKKALSSQAIKFGTFSKNLHGVLFTFTCTSINDKTITRKTVRKSEF